MVRDDEILEGTPEVMGRLTCVLERMEAKSEREDAMKFSRWFRDFDRWKETWKVDEETERIMVVGKLLKGVESSQYEMCKDEIGDWSKLKSWLHRVFAGASDIEKDEVNMRNFRQKTGEDVMDVDTRYRMLEHAVRYWRRLSSRKGCCRPTTSGWILRLGETPSLD